MPVVVGGVALGDMILVLGCIVLLMMRHQIDAWCRPLVVGLTHPHTALWKRVLTAPFRYVLGPAATFALRYAERILAWHVRVILKPCVAFIHGCAVITSELAYLILHFPAEVHWALHYLRHVAIPTLIHAAVAPVAKLAGEAKTLALGLRHDADAIAGSVADSLNGLGWITNADFFGALRNLAHAFAHLWHYVYGEVTARLGVLERDSLDLLHGIDELTRRLGELVAGKLHDLDVAVGGLLDTVDLDLKPFIDALRRGIIPAAMLGAIVAALAAVWDGIFCRNTNAVGRHLCGIDNSLLDAFLADVTGVLVLGSLVEVTRELQGVVRETTEAIAELAEV